MKEKTYVEDVDRNMYDFRNDEKDAYRIKNGLTEDIVEKISEEKHDPEWMHDFRLNSLKIYHEMKVPDWGPSIEGLNMDNIATYVRANTKMKGDWSEVPEEIKDTFEKLGIPQAERTSLAGVGAQYDSELVYHNVRKEVAEQGVIYTDMESALVHSGITPHGSGRPTGSYSSAGCSYSSSLSYVFNRIIAIVLERNLNCIAQCQDDSYHGSSLEERLQALCQ